MKKYSFITALAALALLASCNKNEGPVAKIDNPADGEKVNVTLSINTKMAAETKAAGDLVTDTEAERTIKHLDVFFFKQTAGQPLETYAEGTTTTTDGTYSLKGLTVSNEKLDVYVVANAPASLKAAVSDVASLKAAVSQFTQNDGTNGFVMIGYKEANLPNIAAEDHDSDSSTPNSKLVDGIVLERITNKVTVRKITKAFESPAMQAATVTIEGMYILNAPKSVKYAQRLLSGAYMYPFASTVTGKVATAAEQVDLAPSVADAAAQAASYHNLGRSEFASNPYITQAYSSSNTIAAAPGLDFGAGTEKTFYFYPNPATEAASADASDFVTKLVLLVKVDDGANANLYWYPIGIPQVAGNARNLIYQINNITLRKAGSNANGFDKTDPDGNDSPDDPNDYIDNSVVDVDITVKDWVSADVTGAYNDNGNFTVE